MYRESRDVTHHVTCSPSLCPTHTDTGDTVTYGSCETVPGPGAQIRQWRVTISLRAPAPDTSGDKNSSPPGVLLA